MTMLEKLARATILCKMNDFIIDEINDEDYIMWWLEEGVPDGEDDYVWLAEDRYFLDIVETFKKIVRVCARDTNDITQEQAEQAIAELCP